MPAAIKRTHVDDRPRAHWTVSVVPKAQAQSEDARFWYEEMRPLSGSTWSASACSTASRPRGSMASPMRRVYRCVKRKAR